MEIIDITTFRRNPLLAAVDLYYKMESALYRRTFMRGETICFVNGNRRYFMAAERLTPKQALSIVKWLKAA